MTKNNDLTFEEAMKELESTVKAMENGDLGLDDLLKKFETGIGLLRCCEGKLAEAEAKIEILSKKTIEEPNKQVKTKAKTKSTPKSASEDNDYKDLPLPEEPPMDADSLF